MSTKTLKTCWVLHLIPYLFKGLEVGNILCCITMRVVQKYDEKSSMPLFFCCANQCSLAIVDINCKYYISMNNFDLFEIKTIFFEIYCAFTRLMPNTIEINKVIHMKTCTQIPPKTKTSFPLN